ncbi:hypothetical protein BS50DRAFT_583322 [Corynespora cassiicola Philippines]|uniref:Uncharacterized protein n=1 Tax=Corynespora cassiicola Philippines TaxID=1448308 RepID=A0A2T2P213_CORCC|nr:hypothetical protein BS50DRAFT_583322 [Corynespora cassiicola Philippines]
MWRLHNTPLCRSRVIPPFCLYDKKAGSKIPGPPSGNKFQAAHTLTSPENPAQKQPTTRIAHPQASSFSHTHPRTRTLYSKAPTPTRQHGQPHQPYSTRPVYPPPPSHLKPSISTPPLPIRHPFSPPPHPIPTPAPFAPFERAQHMPAPHTTLPVIKKKKGMRRALPEAAGQWGVRALMQAWGGGKANERVHLICGGQGGAPPGKGGKRGVVGGWYAGDATLR